VPLGDVVGDEEMGAHGVHHLVVAGLADPRQLEEYPAGDGIVPEPVVELAAGGPRLARLGRNPLDVVGLMIR